MPSEKKSLTMPPLIIPLQIQPNQSRPNPNQKNKRGENQSDSTKHQEKRLYHRQTPLIGLYSIECGQLPKTSFLIIIEIARLPLELE